MKKESGIFWNEDLGPLENTFSLIETGAVVLGPLYMTILLTIGAALGWSLKDLGRSLDKTLGLRNASDLLDISGEEVTDAIWSMFSVSEASAENEMIKEAFILRLLKRNKGDKGDIVEKREVVDVIKKVLKKTIRALTRIGLIGGHAAFQSRKDDPSVIKHELGRTPSRDKPATKPATKNVVKKKLEKQIDLALSL